MAIYYPHKQTALILLVCVLAIGGTWFYVRSQSSYGDGQKADTVTLNVDRGLIVSASSTPPTDWQKDFFGAGGSTVTTLNSSKTKQVDEGPLTITDQMGREFFTKYIQLRQANLLGNKDIVDQTSQDLVTATINASAPRVYSSADIRIIDISKGDYLERYSQSITDIINTYGFERGESSILQEFNKTSDARVLKNIDPIIKVYKQMVASLLSTQVPAAMQDNHLSILNSVSAIESAAEDLRHADTDAVRTLSGIGKHVKGVTKLLDTIVVVNNELSRYNIEMDFNPNVWDVMFR